MWRAEAAVRLAASAYEVLRERSFADLTEEERARVSHLIRQLAVRVPSAEQTVPAGASRPRFDVKTHAPALAPHAGRALPPSVG